MDAFNLMPSFRALATFIMFWGAVAIALLALTYCTGCKSVAEISKTTTTTYTETGSVASLTEERTARVESPPGNEEAARVTVNPDGELQVLGGAQQPNDAVADGFTTNIGNLSLLIGVAGILITVAGYFIPGWSMWTGIGLIGLAALITMVPTLTVFLVDALPWVIGGAALVWGLEWFQNKHMEKRGAKAVKV
jgi:hypothetical protein